MMSEAEQLAVALAQLSKVVKPLADEELAMLTTGSVKLALLRPGQAIVQKSKALDAALKFLESLSDEELAMLASRQVRLELLRKEDKVLIGLDLAELAGRIVKMGSEDEIARELSTDSRLDPATLKKLARELSIGVPTTLRTKPALQQHIAQAVMRDRDRFAWR